MVSIINNQITELKSLSKLKMAGRLHYWRGTIEIPETELHAICDEIQAEHDQVITVMLEELGTNYATITAIEVDGQRFERIKECELEYHDTGWVSCRECNTSWKNDRPHIYRRCPYCGAHIKEGGDGLNAS